MLFIGFLPENFVPFLPIAFLTFTITCLNKGFNTLLRIGVSVAAVVATTVIANVVDTVFMLGRYLSTIVVDSYCTTHSLVSFTHLNPTTFSVPFAFKSPILGLFFLGSGHGGSSSILGTSGCSVSVCGGSTFFGGFCYSTRRIFFLSYCRGTYEGIGHTNLLPLGSSINNWLFFVPSFLSVTQGIDNAGGNFLVTWETLGIDCSTGISIIGMRGIAELGIILIVGISLL